MLATEDAVWAATDDGLVRLPRGGGAAEQVTTAKSYLIAATPDAMFVGTWTDITRVAR